MISILIPVYNTLVLALVKELSRQLSESKVEGEIIVIDDHSSTFFRGSNKAVKNFEQVVYIELPNNAGRTAVRQLLAREAKHDWLLFLDSDSQIGAPDFLQRYVKALTGGADVYAGGRSYPEQPKDCKKILHWKYGVHRESVKGSKSVLHTNNFCIRKSVFMALQFPDYLKGYGHEDTWMNIELERLGKTIRHINNPVRHMQLEDAEVFLEKTASALRNLLLLEKHAGRDRVQQHVPLLKTYRGMTRFRLTGMFSAGYRLFAGKISHNLVSFRPSLFFFDLYRLHQLDVFAKDQASPADVAA